MDYWDMKIALYLVGTYPSDNAMTQHAYAIADMLADIGYQTTFIITRLRYNDVNHDTVIDGYRVLAPQCLHFRRGDYLGKYVERLTSSRIISECEKYIALKHPEIVISYGSSYELAKWLKSASRSYGFSVFADQTDWFEAKLSMDLAKSLLDFSHVRRLTKIDPTFDGVISISPFFHDYYLAKKANSFFLPPINRRNEPLKKRSHRKDESISLLYAGSLGGGKDLLMPLLVALDLYSKEGGTQVSLIVAGVTKEEIKCMPGGNALSLKNCSFLGRVGHDKVLRLMEDADFGVLLRKSELYARAGFSTKFSECMRNGVAMLCNSVGGADKLLTPWNDGVVLPDCDVSTLLEALYKLESMGRDGVNLIKDHAFETAQNLFSRDVYMSDFESFIKQSVARKR